MNLNQIYAGNDYAYCQFYRPKGAKFSKYSRRVRAVRAYKKREFGNQKATGYVEVLVLDQDGEITNEDTKHVRARDILSTWEEHEDFIERKKIEQEKYEREMRAMREAQAQRERDQAAVRLRELEEFNSLLNELSIPRHKVAHAYGGNFTVDKTLLLEMLRELQRSRQKGVEERNGESPSSELKEYRSL